MAPAGRKRRRTQYRKRLVRTKKTQESSKKSHCNSPAALIPAMEAGLDTEMPSSICSTPKGQKFLIPELLSCPPAPKKKHRLAALRCSSQNSTVSFFNPPDLEMFFLFALNDVSV